ILVGEEQPYYPLRPLLAELKLEEAARLLGYVPLDTFVTCMQACDVCLNLRRPTAGETSGSLVRALALGKLTLVSDIGAFRELPEEVAIKSPVDDREVDWLYEYMKVLLNEPELRRAVGDKAREYAAQECSWPQVADQYVRFLRQRIGREISTDRHAPTPVRAATVMERPPNGEIATDGGTPSPASAGSSDGQNTQPSFPPEELEDYIVGFSHASPPMEDYAMLHRKRLAHTLQIIPRGGPQDRVLELGCYLQLTPALRKYLGYGEVRGAYYGRSGQTHSPSTLSIAEEAFSCPVDLFDAERDRFPYPDGHFRTVLCCEVLEHLSADPMHMMAEINRTLAPGGCLVLSTPNITGLRSVHAVLHGYHPGFFASYIKPGEDGRADPRHSREYAPREIAILMEAAGFAVELLETGDYGKPEPYFTWVQKLLQKMQCALELRGEVIYCRARKTGPVRERWPQELYYPP
ncbi:MAG: methyltransferase domain-containing protein, partial [Acidobacteria bacterium]|nr:methyltransferase domain-containing protein [Acidobacteriota bacterium]